MFRIPPCPEVDYVERTARSSKKRPTRPGLRPGGVHMPKLQNHERKARRASFSFPLKTPQTHTPPNLTVKSKCTRIRYHISECRQPARTLQRPAAGLHHGYESSFRHPKVIRQVAATETTPSLHSRSPNNFSSLPQTLSRQLQR